ncbi:MAG: glycosyl transferase family 2, partial [Pseudolabrys sp.]
APADVGRWVGQRTRWFKGWMQTWLVHMRKPYRLFRELGFGSFLAFQLIVGGNALVALVHPIFMLRMIFELLRPGSREGISVDSVRALSAHHRGGMSAFDIYRLFWPGARRHAEKAGVLTLTPLHWLLLSIAAWWAAVELIYAPFFAGKRPNTGSTRLRGRRAPRVRCSSLSASSVI